MADWVNRELTPVDAQKKKSRKACFDGRERGRKGVKRVDSGVTVR